MSFVRNLLQCEEIRANAGFTMIGVVLWCDNKAGKAVFWCEDHGDLAYYEEPICPEGGCLFDTGDMVQFDVSVHRRLRIADNPRLIEGGASASLAEALRREGRAARRNNLPVPVADTAQIIPFTPRAVAPLQFTAQLKA